MGPTSKGRRSFLRSGPRLAFPFRGRIVILRKINLRASQSGFGQGQRRASGPDRRNVDRLAHHGVFDR